MKSEKGVTLTSIMIYVIALTVVVITIGRIITYFYKNLGQLIEGGQAISEYTKINSYLTDEINTENNVVEAVSDNYIKFSVTQNQYTYQNGKIYFNKAKICNDIEECKFAYDKEKKEIQMIIKIKGQTYNNSYQIVK